MSWAAGILKSTGTMFVFSPSVLDAKSDERFSRHVGGEGVGSEVQDGTPPLEDRSDGANSHVPVLMRRWIHCIFFEMFAAAALLRDASEELAIVEVASLIEVSPALQPRQILLLVHETLVEALLQVLIPFEQVERAVVVLGMVGAFAAAADRIEHLEHPQLVVAQVVE